MSNYNNLKTTIDANIKQNGNQEITGPILNSVLNQMVNILGTGYQFAGVATLDPATDPGTPDAKVFYIANGKGTYTNFGGLEVTEDDVVVLYWDSSWHKVSTGIASNEKLSELDTQILKRFTKKYTIAQGGSITFDTIVLQEDGDSLEIGVNTSVSSQTNGGYVFSISPDMGFGVTDRLFILRGDNGTWLSTGTGYGAILTNMDYIIKLSYENGNTIVYLNGTEIRRFAQQVKISISGIGNLSKSASYGYWTGTIFKYVYTHNGVSTSIEEFNNLNVNSNVTIINSNPQLSPNVSLGNSQLLQTDNRCKVRYINGGGRGTSTERLEFFAPTNGGYIKYEYVHSVNTAINANNWRIDNAYFCNFDFEEILALTLSGEWEVALHLQGRNDFSGGIAHGDEVMTNIAFFLDGKKVIKEDLTTLTDCREFRAVGMSNMYDPIDSVTLMAKHGCEHVFNMDGVQVNQNIVWQGEFRPSESYMAMFPPKKFGTDQLYMNINYDIETLPSSSFRKTYGFADNVSIFNANSGFFANVQVLDYPRGLHGGDTFWCLDNGGNDYNKMYWVVTTGDIVVNHGTTWSSSVKYSIKYTL